MLKLLIYNKLFILLILFTNSIICAGGLRFQRIIQRYNNYDYLDERRNIVFDFKTFLTIFRNAGYNDFASIETIMNPSFEDVARESSEYLRLII